MWAHLVNSSTKRVTCALFNVNGASGCGAWAADPCLIGRLVVSTPVPLLVERHWTTGISLSAGDYRSRRQPPPFSPQATSSFASCLCNSDVTDSWRNPTSPFSPHAHCVGQILPKFRLWCRHSEISGGTLLLCSITWCLLSLISCRMCRGFALVHINLVKFY